MLACSCFFFICMSHVWHLQPLFIRSSSPCVLPHFLFSTPYSVPMSDHWGVSVAFFTPFCCWHSSWKRETFINSIKWFTLRTSSLFVCTKLHSECRWEDLILLPSKLEIIKKGRLKYHKINTSKEQFKQVSAIELREDTFSFLRFSIFSVSLCSASSLIFLFCSLHSSSRCATSFLSTSVLNKKGQKQSETKRTH